MQDNKVDDFGPNNEKTQSALAPNGFPRPQHVGAGASMQPKSLVTEHQGKLYSPGCSLPELHARREGREDFAKQFADKALASTSGMRAHKTKSAILEPCLKRLLESGWVSDAEGRWTIRPTAELLDWPSPDWAAIALPRGERK
jgi:hypothetical protein